MKRRTVLAALLIVAILFLFGCAKKQNKSILTQSTLMKAIDIDELSTAQFVYNGIAEVETEKGLCHIRYNSEVHVGVNVSDIKVDFDDVKKVMIVKLPFIEIQDVIVPTDSMSFLPSNPDIELGQAIEACKNDVRDEASYSKALFDTAEANLKATIQGLTEPLLKDTEYKLEIKAKQG